MKKTVDWQSVATNILKSELKKKGLSYTDLHDALASVGIEKSVSNLTVTINRGAFSFFFFLQCAAAIGIKNLRLDEIFSDQEIGTH